MMTVGRAVASRDFDMCASYARLAVGPLVDYQRIAQMMRMKVEDVRWSNC